MKKSEMVCKKCVKFETGFCRAYPEPKPIKGSFDIMGVGYCNIDPKTHWCGQGEWHDGAEPRYDSKGYIKRHWPNVVSWGDWDVNEKGEPL